MNIRKILLPLLVVPFLASCGDKPHEHTFSNVWSSDEVNHWKESTCGHDVKDGFGSHIFNEEGVCTECGFIKTNITTSPYIYNGYFGDITITKGEQGTLDDLFNFIFTNGGKTQFTYLISDGLAKYLGDDIIDPFTPDKKLHFSNKKVVDTRTLEDGSSVQTYYVNPVNDNYLCEYAAVPGKENTYRLYDVDNGVCYDHILLERAFFGSPDSVLVICDDVTFDPATKMVTVNMTISGTVGYDVEGQIEVEEVTANYSVIFGDGPEEDVRITKQPEDITISYPDAVDLTVEVSNEDKVINYVWYCGSYTSGSEGSFSPLDGSAVHSSHLHLDGIGSAQSVIPFKCLIQTENREFFTTSALVNVVNTDDFVPTIFMLDHPIKAGESLDLATTPYGNGVVSYAANGQDITFNNVHFNNKNYESNREAVAFSIEARHNTIEEYNFIFEGENIFNHEYWEDVGQGGFAFSLQFPGVDSIKPVINFKGDPISIVGGTNAIYTTGYLHIFNDISLYGYLGRLTRGIVGTSVTIEKGVSISANIGGDLLWSRQGNVEIKEGVKIDAIINCASFARSQGEMYGIMGANNVIIDDAEINLKFKVDYNYFVDKQSMLVPLEGIYASYGGVKIDNSNIVIDVQTLNVPEVPEHCLVNGGSGIGGKMIEITDSDVVIDYQSNAFMQITGIVSTKIKFENSNIDVTVLGHSMVSGIVSSFNAKDPDQPGSISIISTNLNVKAFAEVYEEEGRYYLDAGIRAASLTFDLNIHNEINISTNRASAIVMAFEHVAERPTKEQSYEPTHLLLGDVCVEPSEYEINLDYYTGFDVDEKVDYFVKCEALYQKSSNNYVNEVKIVFSY